MWTCAQRTDRAHPTNRAIPYFAAVSTRSFHLQHLRPELGSRFDTELAVHAHKVGLHALRAHERPLGNLSVGEPRGCELGDPALSGSQFQRRRHPGTDSLELG